VEELAESALPLAGKRVAFAGRLLSCDRALAGSLVLRAGGQVARSARGIDLLVVGNGSERGRRAADRTLTEAQFLHLVGHTPAAMPHPNDIRDLVAAEHAARLYPRVTWSRRRSLARRGLLQPVNLANGIGYRFRDLRVLREVDEMLAAGLSLPQVITRLGPRIRGQLELRFPIASLRPRPRRIDLRDEPESAEAWFDVGFCADRDRSSFPTAIAAYERALKVDATHVPSLINLGNVYYELGEFPKAREHYARACLLDTDNPRTHFNLANACDEMGDLLGAMRAYRRALRLWPGYADAHFNLALVAEKLSAWGLACRHWQKFLDLEAGGEWVAVARSHLEDARQALVRAQRRRRSRGQ
jgi:tetratricopeptide (TPR) repeat protein